MIRGQQQPRGVTGELAERHLADRSALPQLGDVLLHAIVEPELTPLHSLRQHDGLEHLAHRGDVEKRVCRDRAPVGDVGPAMIEEQRAPADADRDGDTTHAVFAQEGRQLSLDQSLDVADVHGVCTGGGGTSDQRGEPGSTGQPAWECLFPVNRSFCDRLSTNWEGNKMFQGALRRKKKAPDFSGAIVQDGEPD
jgi:hypothetical protein